MKTNRTPADARAGEAAGGSSTGRRGNAGLLTGRRGLLAIAWLLLVFLLLRAMILGIAAGLIDPDYFWHLRTGQWIFENGTLPRSDIFSYTAAGEPWVPHEWLFQLLLYLTERLGGDSLIFFLTALLGGTALFLCLLGADRWIKSPVLSLLLTLCLASTFVLYVIPRPHLFSFLFFALLLRWLWAARYDGRLGALAFPPLMMLFWVNLHGGYFIGLGFLLAFTALEGLRLLAGAEKPSPRLIKALLLCSAGSLLAACANPEGPSHLLYPLYVMGQSANSVIGEWKSPDFQRALPQWFLAATFLFLLLAISRRRKPDLTELLLPLATIAAGFTSLRHTPFAVMVMIVYGGQAIGAGALDPLKDSFARFKAARPEAAGGARDLPPRIERLVSGAIVIFLALGILVSTFDPGYAERRRGFKRDITGFIRENALQGPMLNQYGLGGLLIYELYPEHKVYIDGRADLYGDERVIAYNDMVNLRPGWRQTFESGGFGFVVLPDTFALSGYLEGDPDFGLAFQSEDGTQIFLRRLPEHRPLIESFSR